MKNPTFERRWASLSGPLMATSIGSPKANLGLLNYTPCWPIRSESIINPFTPSSPPPPPHRLPDSSPTAMGYLRDDEPEIPEKWQPDK